MSAECAADEAKSHYSTPVVCVESYFRHNQQPQGEGRADGVGDSLAFPNRVAGVVSFNDSALVLRIHKHGLRAGDNGRIECVDCPSPSRLAFQTNAPQTVLRVALREFEGS